MHEQGYDGGENGDGDEDRADGVCNEEVEALDEDGGDDDADAAQGVRQDVQEDPLHVGVVAVAVAAVRVLVSVTAAAEGGHPDEVDGQTGHGHGQQAIGGHYPGRVQQAAEGSGEDAERDHRQEQAVDKAGEHLQAVVPEREGLGRTPPGQDGGVQAHDEGRAVEQHVEAVRDQAQAVGPDAVGEFDKREDWKRELGS